MNAFALFCLMLVGQSAMHGSTSLLVEVENVDLRGGTLRVALFDSAQSHLGQAIVSRVVAVHGTSTSVRFDDLAPGDYSFAIVQDIDGSGGMTRGMLGLPAEPYVFSNDLGAAFGPPSWERAKFHLGAGEQRVSVRLRGSR